MNLDQPTTALGKGLGALISEATPARSIGAPPATGFMRLSPRAILRPPWLPAPEADDPAFDDLLESVREVGILQPILVRRIAGGYELISGSDRLAAATALGHKDIPALVTLADDHQALQLHICENLRRRDLSIPRRERLNNALDAIEDLDEQQLQEILRQPDPPSDTPPPPAHRPAWLWAVCAAMPALALGAAAMFFLQPVLFPSRPEPQQPVVEAVAPAAAAPEPRRVEWTADISGVLRIREGSDVLLVFEEPAFQYGLALSPSALFILEKLASELAGRDRDWRVTLTGYAAPAPLPPDHPLGDHWGVGLARACAALNELRSFGVSADMLAAASGGSRDAPWPEPTPPPANRTVTVRIAPTS